MTEDDAQIWLQDHCGVSRETMVQLDAFRQMVVDENSQQNLISAATIPTFWARHIVDSAQLLQLVPSTSGGDWLDLGTGAGFPGIVIALMRELPITLVESRRKRAEFLETARVSLGLSHVRVVHQRLELMPTRPFEVITARAFAPLPRLFETASRFATKKTVWILPKGQSAREELANISETWHGSFHVKQSVSDPAASIIVASHVQRVDQAKRLGKS
jgi:16S rRNA (guanine527-N7)-methyltransferase